MFQISSWLKIETSLIHFLKLIRKIAPFICHQKGTISIFWDGKEKTLFLSEIGWYNHVIRKLWLSGKSLVLESQGSQFETRRELSLGGNLLNLTTLNP